MSTVELTPLLTDIVDLFWIFLVPVVSGESRDSLLLMFVAFLTVDNRSVVLFVDFTAVLSTEDEISGLLLLDLLASL